MRQSQHGAGAVQSAWCLLALAVGLTAAACGGATLSQEGQSVDGGRGDGGAGQPDGGGALNDGGVQPAEGGSPHDAGSADGAADGPNVGPSDDASPGEDADDAAVQITACESCLQIKCAASYATCGGSAACMTELKKTALCQQTSQADMPGELVLCLGKCDSCGCQH